VLTGSAHSQQARTPRLDDVMTPANQALIVEAMEKAGSPLAKAYAQGAPLRWTHVADVEQALEALGTPEAAALAAQIEAVRPPANKTEVEPSGPSPKKLTFEDGFNEGWAELNGPQFLLPWSAQDIETVRRALAKMEDEHIKYPDGIDDYQMGRRARFIEKLDTFAGIVLGDDGSVFRWVSLREINMVGRSVSRDRYCRAEDQDVDDLQFLEAGVECYIRNAAAIALFERIAKARHMTPGGKQ
jgi:hypothetical protein